MAFILEALINGKKDLLYKSKKLKENIRLGIRQTDGDKQTIIFDTTITGDNTPEPPKPDVCKEGEHWDEELEKCVPNTNNPPRAQSFPVETFINDDIDIELMGSDIDVHDTLTYIINKPPENGTLSLPNGNMVTYLPNDNFKGTDSFNYSAFDTKENSNVATITITVVDKTTPPPPPDEEGKVLWTSEKWANGNARIIKGVARDPDDKQLEMRAGQSVDGEKQLEIDGKGEAKQTGERYRQYIWKQPPTGPISGGGE